MRGGSINRGKAVVGPDSSAKQLVRDIDSFCKAVRMAQSELIPGGIDCFKFERHWG